MMKSLKTHGSVLIIWIFFFPMAWGATFFVAPNGDDANSGSVNNPFRTIQHAVDTVNPGSIIKIKAGTYQETVRITRSGSPGQMITLEGEPGAVIDGGDHVSGWVLAPEVGPLVYKITEYKKKLGYEPRNMTWNDKYFIDIELKRMETSEGFQTLALPATDPFWDGVEALFGSKPSNGTVYVRFRNGLNPNNENITVQKKNTGAVFIDGASFIVIRGLTIKNSYSAVRLWELANDNIIENNILLGGHETVYLQGHKTTGPARNHIRDNEITLNYIYEDYGNYWTRTNRDLNIWRAFKRLSTKDRTGVKVLNAGADNQIYRNHIYKHHDGITQSRVGGTAKTNKGIKIYENNLHNLQDSGIEAIDNAINAEWHDNRIHEATTNLRIKKASTGPFYIYRNRVSNETQVDKDNRVAGRSFKFSINTEPNTLGKVYIYHNSFVMGGTALDFSTVESAPSTEKLANFWLLNNIFSSGRFYTRSGGFGEPRSHFRYNWAGGTYFYPESQWPPGLDTREDATNILEPNATLWNDRTQIDFSHPQPSNKIEAKGIDLSQPFTVDGVNHAALPGMASGYFSGARPDLGAVQLSSPGTIDTTAP